MSEIIDGQAEKVIELSEESIQQMSTAEKAELEERVDQMQTKIADGVLKGEKGWDIIRELGLNATKQILATSPFVLPYMQNKQAILFKLQDPEGFAKQFDTLMGDIERHSITIKNLAAKHQGKTGVPTEDEQAAVFLLADEYSRALEHFDNVIEPLMNSLIETIKAEHGPILTVNVDEQA